MKFGAKLKKLRTQKGLTQSKVADEIKITRRAYISYEQDNVRPRNRETYERLASVLGCDINYLLVDDNEEAIKNISSFLSSVSRSSIKPTMGRGSVVGTVSMAVAGLSAEVISEILQSTLKAKNDDPDRLSKANRILMDYTKQQKQFSATAMGIILRALADKNVKYQLGNIKDVDVIGGPPDEIVKISGNTIKEWWFNFWTKNDELDGRTFANKREQAEVILGRYLTSKADSSRKVSIAVDDDQLFDALLEFKNHNSYKGNLSAILIDVDAVTVKKEQALAFYSDQTDIISLL